MEDVEKIPQPRFVVVFKKFNLNQDLELGQREFNLVRIFCRLQEIQAIREDSFFFRRSANAASPTESIIACTPIETIRMQGGTATIENSDGKFELKGDPFQVLSKRMDEYRVPHCAELPFFQGGALGFFSYDSVRFLEPTVATIGNLQKLSQKDLSSGTKEDEGVEPGTADGFFRIYQKAIVFDHIRRCFFICSGYLSGDEGGAIRADREIDHLRMHLQSELQAELKGFFPQKELLKKESPFELVKDLDTQQGGFESLLGMEKFLDGVKKLKRHIQNGDIFQAVLSEKFRRPFKGNPLRLFQILCELSPSPYQFYCKDGEKVYLGASPELLVRIEADQIETHPIAGTRPIEATERSLLSSVKERAEHLMLVDLARNDMGRVAAPGTVRVSEFMQVKKFAAVMHLVSRVKGRLKKDERYRGQKNQGNAIEALASFFPAGTLSGAPKIRAIQLISEIEPEPRGFYGGAVMAASFSGDIDACISIRCIQIENGMATIQAGAGIVADSNPEKEYAEVHHKSRMARRALQRASAEEDL